MTREIPAVPTSWGEVVDKITILEIKKKNMTEERALLNVEKELAMLSGMVENAIAGDPVLSDMKRELLEINSRLWVIEDRIREKEADRAFDEEFIELARSVYRTNDLRAAVKRRINIHLSSEILEEKSYKPY
ncbi:conserved hypothetical protein [uncultured Pleomorphomonas sp.]|uniref:Uncharacterized protein n=1 Tax=uncultured Pleomorphomonas sp. TaxID=442121 RepID=A0A212LGF8_9HYPH|nr:DUF6165 family protein [uncultured Pleomorphomonas sp.]SCM76646.1 conserved hypothetical protein [uncultured Pleomorphomonas sp.]